MCAYDMMLLVAGMSVHVITSTSVWGSKQLCDSLLLCDINCKVVAGFGVQQTRNYTCLTPHAAKS